MPLVITAVGILVLLFLIMRLKVQTLIALAIVSFLLALALGMPLDTIAKAMEKGFGDTLGGVGLIFVFGAIVGKLLADAGGAMPIQPSLRLGLDMLTHPRWLLSRFVRTLHHRGIPHIENVSPSRGPSIFARDIGAIGGAAGFNWKHVRAIRERWQGTLLLKGILSVDDARQAQHLAVDGIIVSNHGARLSDTAISPLEALPDIKAACPDLPLLLDGGVRRAEDALKAVALGASAVMIGRPFFYAAIVAGQHGISHAINLVHAELRREMGFHGLRSVDEVSEPGRLKWRTSPPSV